MNIFDLLLKFIGIRPRSESEIRGWLKKKKVEENESKELFDRLNKLGLVSDLEFAKWWVEQRMAFRPKGKRALIFELKSKGVSDGVIREILETAGIDEAGLAKKLLDKHMYRWQKLGERESKIKMSQFLAQRGFDWEASKSAIDSSLSKE